MIRRVGAYTRISDDTEATGDGVVRQDYRNTDAAKAREWFIAERYEDNDYSAYKRGVVRPDFERMLRDLASGKIDGIICTDLDRLARKPKDLERILDIFEARRKDGLLFASASGDIDLSTDQGILMARVLVSFANKASADTGRRTKDKHQALAKAGKPVGGRRPFGWAKDKATLVPSEAAVMRAVVASVIAGESLRSQVRYLNNLGFKTTAGKAWIPVTLRRYLRNPRLVGQRTYLGELQMDDEGRAVAGLWEPLLEMDVWERLQHMTAPPPDEGRARVPRAGARHYLLTGIVRCWTCQGLMYGSRQSDTYYNYVCQQAGDVAHSNAISGPALDAMVEALVLAFIAEEPLDASHKAVWSNESELATVQVQIDELMKQWGEGVSAETVFPRVKQLEATRELLRLSRAQWITETSGPKVEKVSPEAWRALTTVQRRAAIEQNIDTVFVRPATRRMGNRVDRGRVVPVARISQTNEHAAAA